MNAVHALRSAPRFLPEDCQSHASAADQEPSCREDARLRHHVAMLALRMVDSLATVDDAILSQLARVVRFHALDAGESLFHGDRPRTSAFVVAGGALRCAEDMVQVGVILSAGLQATLTAARPSLVLELTGDDHAALHVAAAAAWRRSSTGPLSHAA